MSPASTLSSHQQVTASDDWMEALSYPIFGLSEEQKFLFANYAAEVFFERSRHLLLKSHLSDFFLEDSPIFGLLRRLSAGRQSVSDQEMTLISPRLGKKLVTIHMATHGEEKTQSSHCNYVKWQISCVVSHSRVGRLYRCRK